MIVLDIHLSGIVRWRFTESDPLLIRLPDKPPFGVVNPLVLYHLLGNRPESTSHRTFNFGLRDREAVLVTDTLGVAVDTTLDPEEIPEWMSDLIPKFLSALRCASGQADMALSAQSLGTLEVDELPPLRFPDRTSATGAAASSYLWDSALTLDDIRVGLVGLLRDGYLPSYRVILLDAIQGLWTTDYRKCIVYSAVAMETMASTVLGTVYQKRLSKEGMSAKDLRVISLPQAGGTAVVKDPVYDYLSRTKEFKHWLHEIPLYLLGRSMLIEDQDLYRTALQVYKVRNDIVHHGEPDQSSNRDEFQLSNEGALKAISSALDVFKWFGEGERYPLPFQGITTYQHIQL